MTDLTEAVKNAAIDAPRLYPVGSVPKSPTYPYGVFAGVLGGGATYTLEGRRGLRHGLVSLQSFGRTIDSATDHMEKVLAALLDVPLMVGTTLTTPLVAGLDAPSISRDNDDNGVITAAMPLTFTIPEEP